MGQQAMITSSHNSKIKLIRALAGRSKERRENGAFLAEGVRLVEEAFIAGWNFRIVLYTDGLNQRGLDLVQSLTARSVDVESVAENILQSVTETETPQGILAVLALDPPDSLQLPTKPDFVLIPDQIRDPGNLGTLLRTAAAAGVQAVFIPPETTDPFAPKVVRAGMGAHFRLQILSLSWDLLRARVAGIPVYLSDAEGEKSCWEVDFTHPTVLVIGGEADGASVQARNLSTEIIRIPMPGKMESLNAGVAGSVLMYEVVRQRSRSREER
jgi:TrmH family RNA methyltransferase